MHLLRRLAAVTHPRRDASATAGADPGGEATASTPAPGAAEANGGAGAGAPLPFLPECIWEKIFAMLPATTVARLPARDPVYRDTLRREFGFDDVAAMGPSPRRILATACGVAHARRLEVTRIPMPPSQPSWDYRRRRRDGEAAAALTGGKPLRTWPFAWGRPYGELATWGMKVGFVVQVAPQADGYGCHQTVGVAVFDVADGLWTPYENPGVWALALGPEGIFAAGGGRVSLTGWSGRETWAVDARLRGEVGTPYFAHLGLGHARLGGITVMGAARWWDRATGAHLGDTGLPPPGHVPEQFARLADGFAGGTRSGRFVVWPDDNFAASPHLRGVDEGHEDGTRVGERRVVDVRSGPFGTVSGHAPAGVRWRPRLGAPPDAAQTWPQARPCARTLVQVGPAILWKHGPVNEDGATLMRVRLSESTPEAVVDLPRGTSAAIACAGAYWTLDMGRRALLRVAGAQGIRTAHVDPAAAAAAAARA